MTHSQGKEFRILLHEPQVVQFTKAQPIFPVEYTQAVFHVDEIFDEQIFRQIDHIMDRGERPGHVLLGRDLVDKFINDMKVQRLLQRNYYAFDLPHQWTGNYLHPGWIFASIRIHIIPWMSGVIVVPKLCPCDPKEAPLGWAEEDADAAAVGMSPGLLRKNIHTDIGNIKDGEQIPSDVAETIAEWMRVTFKRWMERPPKKFMRSRKFLWWWF